MRNALGNILVTGGTGFVGSHLIEKLNQKGYSVTTTIQQDDPRSYFRIKGLGATTKLEQADITHFDTLYNLVTKHEIEYIFHLAAQPIVDVAYYNPRRTLETNINGTINVLECARLYPNIKGVIVASSDKAYGKHGRKKYMETDELRGDHPYEVSKSAADLICTTYFKTYGLPVITTRFGNIYGEGDQNYSRILPGIMKALVTGVPLKLRSDGSLIRDYLYVGDVVDGYIQLLSDFSNYKGEVFNFGGSETLSVLQVIYQVEKALNKKVPVEIMNYARNEIPYQSLDYSKITKHMGWKPTQKISDVASSMLSYYTSIL